MVAMAEALLHSSRRHQQQVQVFYQPIYVTKYHYFFGYASWSLKDELCLFSTCSMNPVREFNSRSKLAGKVRILFPWNRRIPQFNSNQEALNSQSQLDQTSIPSYTNTNFPNQIENEACCLYGEYI